MMKTAAAIPNKMSNQRVTGKNARALSDGAPSILLLQRTMLLYVGGEVVCG